jgi:outer membrane immunogenic protein
MRRTAIALMATTAVGLYFGASAASAADLRMALKSPAPAAATLYNWTGCYVGVQGGVGAQQDNYAGGSEGENGYGAVLGGQLGCNYQMGMLVVGIEGDGLWSNLKNTFSEGSGSGTSTDPGSSLNEGFSESSSSQSSARNKWLFDAALRLGVAFDRVLIYGKGGVAWGKFDFSTNTSSTTIRPGLTEGFTEGFNGSATLPGALIGVGFEYAIPGLQNVTAKAEYNYIAFAQRSVSGVATATTTFSTGSPASITTTVPSSQSYGANIQMIKFGLNVKFNGP